MNDATIRIHVPRRTDGTVERWLVQRRFQPPGDVSNFSTLPCPLLDRLSLRVARFVLLSCFVCRPSSPFPFAIYHLLLYTFLRRGSTFSKPHVRKRSSAHLRKPRPGTLATPRRQHPCRSHTPDFTTSTASTATRPGHRSQSFALRTLSPPARRSPPWLPQCSRIHRQPTQQTAPGNSRAPQPTYLSNSHPTYHDTRSNPAKTPTNKAASSPSQPSTKASTPAPPPAQS